MTQVEFSLRKWNSHNFIVSIADIKIYMFDFSIQCELSFFISLNVNRYVMFGRGICEKCMSRDNEFSQDDR
jgi:hypothetical protein